MGEVLAKRDNGNQCWARIKLENGDLIFVSIAPTGVNIHKMKWRGWLPGPILWRSQSVTDVGEKFFRRDPYNIDKRPLDLIIDRLIDCRSAGEICVLLM